MISSTGTETILVVDDSETVCELIEILLCRVGYRVLTATSGNDALQIAEGTPEIHLLLTNIEMPGMRGDEVAEQFASIHPSAAIVFLTSFERSAKTARPFEVLLKPFTVAELRDTVRHALRTHPMHSEAPFAA